MFEVLTKDNRRYTVEAIQHQANGIIFEYNDEMLLITHNNIKEINGDFQTTSAKAFLKK